MILYLTEVLAASAPNVNTSSSSNPYKIVFIRQIPMVKNRNIAAVIIDNEATLKRVYYYPEKNKLVLNRENPAFEPLVYINEEPDTIRILGKAVYFMSAI